MNTFIQGLNRKENSKGGIYHGTTFSENLNLFSYSGRYASVEEIQALVSRAYSEDKELLFKNILYLLDIRGGKGERRFFKYAFEKLIELDIELGEMVLKFIGELGRYDYILFAYDTPLKSKIIELIREQLSIDLASEKPTLLAKWLPSINTSSKEKVSLAKQLCKDLEWTNEQYRKNLSRVRKQINIVETKMSQENFENIDYSKIPSKAMLKYHKAFSGKKEFIKYKDSLAKGETKINVKGITPAKIVSQINQVDRVILDKMWDNLDGIDVPENKNVLVMADVSGSMRTIGNTNEDAPINSSIGLALYFSQKNKGAFKDIFLTFSTNPRLVQVVGKDVRDKLYNIFNSDDEWSWTTNIDKAFKLILDSTLKSKKEDLPSHLVIVSDMEFDKSSGNRTNFEHWTNEYAKHDLVLPKIIFWNVAQYTNGFPVTQFDSNVAMVSGYSPNVAKNLFSLENISPIKVMLETLKKYDNFLVKKL